MRKILVSSLFLMIFVCAANAQFYIPPPPPLPPLPQLQPLPVYQNQQPRVSYSNARINPGNYVWFNKKISYWTSNVYVAKFEASSPLEVFVLDEKNFYLFQNGKSFFSYYSSGRVSDGGFNMQLKNGKYFLVVSNTFSIITGKDVKITFFD